MGIEEVVIAPRAPWQNPFAERVIGSVRRECLDHVIVWNERSSRRLIIALDAIDPHRQTAWSGAVRPPRTAVVPDVASTAR